jgi:virginiamycin B lyase
MAVISVWMNVSASLAGNHIAKIDRATGKASVIEPPTQGQGARRVWSDSTGRIWVSEYHAGQVAVFDPAAKTWKSWKLPGDAPAAYAIYVDATDTVWLSDFGGNAHPALRPEERDLPELPVRPRGRVGPPVARATR